MKSLRSLYKIGHGPSSSHTMGPHKACQVFLNRYPNCDHYIVILYGSLALTGKGHLTDKIIMEAFEYQKVEIKFDYMEPCEYHPNMMDIIGVYDNNKSVSLRFYSVGGGSIEIEGEGKVLEEDIYKENTLDEIKKVCAKNKWSLVDYVVENEGDNIYDYVDAIYDSMHKTIEEGLKKDGVLPGKLGVKRRAKDIYETTLSDENLDVTKRLFAYAYATSEENASGGIVVTAPTCGASGLLPAIVRLAEEQFSLSRHRVCKGLLVSSLIGNLIKQNASISGAEAGCQAEIGVACSMGAAFYAYVLGASIDQIEVAAEIALEHHLGLTCDPVMGYVQIPCIERNAVCALRAIDAARLSIFVLPGTSKISFDMIVKTMLKTGHDINSSYRETSLGGLASLFGE